MHKLKYALQSLESSAPDDLRPVDPPLSIRGDFVFILSDLHIPFHNKPWLRSILKHASSLRDKYPKAKIVAVIAGDFCDFNMFSNHGQVEKDTSFRQAITFAGLVMDSLAAVFHRIHICPGNHDVRPQRIIKKLTGDFGFWVVFKLIQDAMTPGIILSRNISMTERNFIEINTDQEFPWAAVHPVSYSKIPNKVPTDLATRHQVCVVSGHTHHPPSFGNTPCGKFVGLENGALLDTRYTTYTTNMSMFPQHMNGYTLLIRCKDKTKFAQYSQQGFNYEKD